MKRLAVVDLLFSWPPAGGAAVDLYENFRRLTHLYEIKVFYLKCSGSFPRGQQCNDDLPFATEAIEVENFDKEEVSQALIKQLTSWQTDFFFFADGWTLKAHLAYDLKQQWPGIVRFYAYEMLCPRNNEKWLHDRVCNNSFLKDPDTCRQCCRDYASIVRQHRGPDGNPLIQEFEAADIEESSYAEKLHDILSGPLIVSNTSFQQELANHGYQQTFVLGGGVNQEKICQQRQEPPVRPFKILAAGRMNDPAKGAQTLIEAGHLLAQENINFQVIMTREPTSDTPSWLYETGWLSQEQLQQQMQACHIAVVPSLWQEAFGLTIIESMAAGLPVISTHTAGPGDIIHHQENGLLFEPGNARQLADLLLTLHKNPSLRKELATNGQKTVSQKFTWDKISQQLAGILEKLN